MKIYLASRFSRRHECQGGRHVEFGYAIAKGKVLVVIGCRETVFHHLPRVNHFNSVNDFLCQIETGGKHPPTLYEIRSLSIWLYEQQEGKDYARIMAAHSDGKMTDLYLSRRDGEEIITGRAGLKL